MQPKRFKEGRVPLQVIARTTIAPKVQFQRAPCCCTFHKQTASPALQGRLALAWLLQLLVAVLPRPGAGEALSSLQPYDTTCAAGTNCSTDTCAPQSRRWMLLLEPLHNDCGLPALAWQITQGGARLHPPPCAGPATQGR